MGLFKRPKKYIIVISPILKNKVHIHSKSLTESTMCFALRHKKRKRGCHCSQGAKLRKKETQSKQQLVTRDCTTY